MQSTGERFRPFPRRNALIFVQENFENPLAFAVDTYYNRPQNVSAYNLAAQQNYLGGICSMLEGKGNVIVG